MDKWMIAVWLIVNAKNGISSYEVARALGVTQKSAWFMMHRVRLALHEKQFVQIGGSGKEVEVDETFIGGAARFMHADKRREKITDRGVKGKAAVMGILERGGQVRANVIPTRRKHHLQAQIRAHVKAHSAIYTDALLSYQGLNNQDFVHETIDHAERYVDGQVHTNGLENFWSLAQARIEGYLRKRRAVSSVPLFGRASVPLQQSCEERSLHWRRRPFSNGDASYSEPSNHLSRTDW